MVEKILFITLSNIGDTILSLPVLDYLRQGNPGAKITVMAGARVAELFRDNPDIARLIIYDKRANLKENVKLFNALKKEKFDMVIDLRNTFFGAFLPAKSRIPPWIIIPKEIEHMRQRHLYKLRTPDAGLLTPRRSLYIKPEDEEYINKILEENGITKVDNIVVIAAGARSHIKRWPQEKFAQLTGLLIKEFKVKVILAGDKEDAPINRYILQHAKAPVLDLSGQTTITQLAYLLQRARLLITNDSAVLHLGSYVNIPVAAIFGPTNELKYGPWSDNRSIVKKDIACRPCEKARCKSGDLKCLHLVKVEDVLRKIRDLFSPSSHPQTPGYRRILIVRTDRIGDVILSTPVIKALRDSYPDAYIAMMVSPYAKDIVEGNPWLDDVIIYDKEGKHKGWLRSAKFALNLKKKKFNLALVLHPTNRVHLVTFFAGIPKRVGYDRKLGFLLTDRIKHTKQLGEKHELEYSLDLVRYLGITPADKNLYMPIKQESEAWADEFFAQEGIKKTDSILAIHPGASCPSKIWPSLRFAQVADKLAGKYGFKVLIIAGPKDIADAELLIKNMQHKAINLAGKVSLSHLAGILKRCRLFISNDSGPVHIAAAVGTPVISIFGRKQNGLSPKRWGPVGRGARILHKDVGCIQCLAHNCVQEFECLKAISTDDVLSAADALIKDTL